MNPNPVSSTPPPVFDALLPPAMARRAEEVGVAKASLDVATTLALAVLAGAFIALGGIFSTVASAGATGAPWGAIRVLAGVVFSVGLVLVVVGGAELFTGNNLIAMAWASGRVSTGRLLRNWALVFAGNFAGAVGIAALALVARLHELGGGAIGVAAVTAATAKLGYGFTQAVALGILCNLLVCLAVWLAYSARTTTDRIVAIVPPIAAFVASGFEHSVANMYIVPFGLLVAAAHPDFLAARALGDGLTWWKFLVSNLLPVTLGNVLGGTILVGGTYWFVYLRAPADDGRSPQVATSTTQQSPTGA